MSGWKGWNEADVRWLPVSRPPSGSDSSTVPVTMGFTAINAPKSGGFGIQPTPTGYNSTHNASTATEGQANAHTFVSEYLGRGEPADDPPVTQALHGPGTKKAGGKSKKRASITSAPASRKRRKTSDVSDGMTVTKSSVQRPTAQPKAGDVSVERDQAVVHSSSSLQQPHGSTIEFYNGPPQSVPVYTPATSMDSIHNAAQQTSVDALKDANGRGTTLYRRTQTSAQVQASISYAQPWLNEQTAAPDQSGTAVEGRRLRPRKGNVKYTPDVEQQEYEPAVNMQTKRQTRSTAPRQTNALSKRKAAPKHASARNSSRTSEEDFLGEDDLDEAAVLALTNDIEQVERCHGESKKTSPKTLLPTPASSDEPVVHENSIPRRPSKRKGTPILTLDEEFIVSDDEDQDEIAELVDAAEEAEAQRSSSPPPRERKLNTREVDKHEDYGGALLSDEERQILEKLKSSATQDGPKPIVRLPFPTGMLDRSPIFGASNTTVLRTCFRIGEALKEGAQAVRCNKNMILEIYARVTSSWRETPPGRKQHVVLKDLYHDNPPHLEGSYELWHQSRLWELDSKAFLMPRKEGIICRAIAKMKRVERQWKLEILSIWEASWGDVDYAAGIYAKGTSK